MNDILRPGDLFLEYRLLEIIGEGGMGIVFKAVHEEFNDIVAIKCLSPRHASREDFAARFKQECKIYPVLRHPHIVRMRRAGISTGPVRIAFIVMDLLEGKTLRRLLYKYHRLDYLNALHVMIQIAEPLRFAHSKGIVHRDLKPENIMVGAMGEEKGHVWLMDFGIAKTADGSMNTDDMPDLGTARYMAPEHVRNVFGAARKRPRMKLDGRIDIYAFGVIFYEVITGQHIFINDEDPPSFEETLSGHLLADPKPVHTLVPDCPEGLWPVIARCLAVNREERYATFDEVLEDLRELIRASVPPEHPLARRVVAEKVEHARRAAFASLPEAEEGEDGSGREAVPPPEAGQRKAATDLAPTVRVPAERPPAREEQDLAREPEGRMTAPLVNFVPAANALPFVPAGGGASRAVQAVTSPLLMTPSALSGRAPVIRGRGFTARMPTAAPRAKFPSGGFFPEPEAPASPGASVRAAQRPTPSTLAGVMTASRPTQRVLLLAPLLGLAITVIGSVTMVMARAGGASVRAGAGAAEPVASAATAPAMEAPLAVGSVEPSVAASGALSGAASGAPSVAPAPPALTAALPSVQRRATAAPSAPSTRPAAGPSARPRAAAAAAAPSVRAVPDSPSARPPGSDKPFFLRRGSR